MAISAGKIFAHHQSHLKHDGMVKFPQIKAGQLLDLFQAVYQGISVNEQLPGSFGHIQVVLKELIDGKQSLLIQRIDSTLLEYFGQEDVTQSGGQLIDQTADTQVLIIDNAPRHYHAAEE